MIPTKSENPKGLYNKYIVAKSNGQPIDENAEYFILRLDKFGKDSNHIKACRKAVIAYAVEIQDHLPKLAQDIIDKYGSEQLDLHGVVKSLPQDNYCEVCKLPTDGEKCYSKRCPV
jgi:hypothetical protein